MSSSNGWTVYTRMTEAGEAKLESPDGEVYLVPGGVVEELWREFGLESIDLLVDSLKPEWRVVKPSPDRGSKIHFVKTPRGIERAAFGDKTGTKKTLKEAVRQGVLSEYPEEPETAIDSYGLRDLTEPDAKALHAVQILFSKTGYKGNLPVKKYTSEAGAVEDYPCMSFTLAEFHAAYGLKRSSTTGKFTGSAREEAKEALTSLWTTKRRLAYMYPLGDGNTKIRVISSTLVFLLGQGEEYTVPDAQAPGVMAKALKGEKTADSRESVFAVMLNRPLVDGLDNFFFLKSERFFEEIKEAHKELYGSQQDKEAVRLFCQWIYTQSPFTGRDAVIVTRKKLYEVTGLDKHIKERHKDRAEKALKKALEIAKHIGYLTDYQDEPINAGAKILLYQDPERCSLARKQKALPGETPGE